MIHKANKYHAYNVCFYAFHDNIRTCIEEQKAVVADCVYIHIDDAVFIVAHMFFYAKS